MFTVICLAIKYPNNLPLVSTHYQQMSCCSFIGVSCQGAMLVERAASVGEGFSQEAPLVYTFGHLSPASNLTLYNILVSRMAATIQDKMVANRKGTIFHFIC